MTEAAIFVVFVDRIPLLVTKSIPHHIYLQLHAIPVPALHRYECPQALREQN